MGEKVNWIKQLIIFLEVEAIFSNALVEHNEPWSILHENTNEASSVDEIKISKSK